MAGQFDKVARALASDMPRRKVLRMAAGGVTAAFSAAVLGKNAVAQAEDDLSTPLLFVNTKIPKIPECNYSLNYTTNYCPPDVNQGPPDKVVIIKVPFINQAGVPYLPGIIEDILPDIRGIDWVIVPVPAPPIAVPVPNSPEPPPKVIIEVPQVNQGNGPDIGRIIGDRLSKVPNVNWSIVPFKPGDRGR